MRDPLTKSERSALMAKVRSRGNRSTEYAVEKILARLKMPRWTKHPKAVPGCPDFYFPSKKIAVFVDGCFWHSCPKCGRIPKTRVKFWAAKIDDNRRRDQRIRRQLRSEGHHVVRIWEHDIPAGAWVTRLRRMLAGS